MTRHKPLRHRWAGVAILSPFVVVLLAGFITSSYQPAMDRIASPTSLSREMARADVFALADLNEGIEVTQEFDLQGFVFQPESEIGPFARRSQGPEFVGDGNRIACLNLLFGTHNRKDHGSVLVELQIDALRGQFVFEAEDIRDNNPESRNYSQACFRGISERDILTGHAGRIRVEGLDSSDGNAVTLWTTRILRGTAAPALSRVTQMETEYHDRSLIMNLSSRSQQTSLRSIFLLSGLGAILVSTVLCLIWIGVSEEGRQGQLRHGHELDD